MSSLIADVREQVLYLQELGVETFDFHVESGKLRVENAETQIQPKEIISNVGSEISNFRSEIPNPVQSKPDVSRLSSLPSLSKRPSSPPLTTRGAVENRESEATSTMLKAVEVSKTPQSSETIEQIRAEIGSDCTRCKLSTLGRTQIVNSTGNFNADLMFVGEAPGADEDEQGFPFVGRAGKLLTDIMMAIGFSRDDVFIGNINRCRPPGNRAPEPDETVACKPFLKREIAVVRPKVIVVLGATAAQNLLETKVPIGKLRGQFHDYLGTKVMPTFHPAYLLRDPHKKREVWEDMKMVRDYLTSVK